MALKVDTSIANKVWHKQMHFEKSGDIMEGHSHVHDHNTLLAAGRLQVCVDGVVAEFAAPHIIFIPKGKRHHLIALEDNTVAYCIHPLPDELYSGDMTPEHQTISANNVGLLFLEKNATADS